MKTTKKTKFSEHITTLVRDHPDSISSLCRKIPVARTYMYNIMNGRSIPSKKIIYKIMNVLDLSYNDRVGLLNLYSAVEGIERPKPEQPRVKDNLERINLILAHDSRTNREWRESLDANIKSMRFQDIQDIRRSVAANQKMISEIQASVEKIQEQLMIVVWMQGNLAGYDKE